MANDTNKIKLLVLWDILCKNTDENHAMNSDEIREELAKRGISVMRKVVATDIAALNKYGYEVLSYKKKYYYYYVVSRPLETAEVVMLADVIKASKLTSTQKNIMIEKLSGTLCSHQAENLSKHIISLDKSRKGSSSLIYNVDAIERGIEENKQISFLYFDYDEKHKKVYRKNGDRYMVNPAFITLDSQTNSSIAHVIQSNGMSMLFFDKAGTYNLSYNVETGVLSITSVGGDDNQGDGDESGSINDYIIFISVMDNTNGNQTLYPTKNPEKPSELYVRVETIAANSYISVSAMSKADYSTTYGTLANTDSSVASNLTAEIISVKVAGPIDIYFNFETKTVRIVAVS